MNRKIKIKYFYKIAASKQMTIREKIMAGLLGLGTMVGVSQVSGQDEIDSPVRINGPTEQVQEADQGLEYIDYKIEPNDNIMKICLRLFPKHASRAMKHIMEVNNLTEESAKDLKVGQIIKIPISRERFVDHFDLEENHRLEASSSIKEYIKDKEKLILEPTDVEKSDNQNVKTVGYGHRLDTNARKDDYLKQIKLLKQVGRKNGKLTVNDPIIIQWFNEDIKEAEDKVKAKALPSLTKNQFDALVSFAFNTGGVPDIKLDLLSGNVTAAADKIRNHPSASDPRYPGLAIRRAEEADLFMSN